MKIDKAKIEKILNWIVTIATSAIVLLDKLFPSMN